MDYKIQGAVTTQRVGIQGYRLHRQLQSQVMLGIQLPKLKETAEAPL